MTRWPPRPTLSPAFYKAHGLGNDYLVFEEGEGWCATQENVHRVCDRFRGAGGDGIVVLLHDAPASSTDRHRGSGERASAGEVEVGLRMFNPDGGEFERSGNGLRVLGSCLARRDPSVRSIVAHVGGDRVVMSVHGRSGPRHDLSAAMGRATLGPGAVDGDPEIFEHGRRNEGAGSGTLDANTWVLDGPDGAPLTLVPVSVGNPHLVVLVDDPARFSEDALARIGPFLSGHRSLRFGANVQLALPVEGRRCRALIWERGVGRTSASGTSSCAVAVAMIAAGRMAPGEVRVEMPGGTLSVDVTPDRDVTLRGPVEEVMEGALSEALLATFEPGP